MSLNLFYAYFAACSIGIRGATGDTVFSKQIQRKP